MTRSFVVAIVFLEARVIGGVTGLENLGVHAVETIVWTCLAFSILSADLVLQWQQLRTSPSLFRRNSPAPPERMGEAPLDVPGLWDLKENNLGSEDSRYHVSGRFPAE